MNITIYVDCTCAMKKIHGNNLLFSFFETPRTGPRLDRLLCGAQIDLTVALNFNTFIQGKLKCLGNIVESAVGIDSRNPSMVWWLG